MTNLRSYFQSLCFALIILAVAGLSNATPYEIPFKSGAITPQAGVYQIPKQALAQTDANRVHVLLQLENYLAKGQQEELSSYQIELLSYFPDRAYLASVPTNLKTDALSKLGIRSVVPFYAEYKLNPRVINRSFGSWSEYSNGRRIFSLEIAPDVLLETAASSLANLNCEVGTWLEAAHSLLIAVEPDKIAELASADFISYIDEVSPPMDELNGTARTRAHVNEVQAAPYNLSGNGVTILVYDGGMVDSTHPDFGDRIHWLETHAIADHATHVAGTVGCDGGQSGGANRGMAPQATIISGQYDACVPFCLYESPNDFQPDYTLARQTFNIELTTNSIGANISPNGYSCEWFGDYESTSRLLDGMTRSTNGAPLTMFFAAGNERGDPGCANSSYACMSVPAGAKNIITIGATTSTDATASFSSWGPTDDGRVKPEICSYGVNVTSTRPGPTYGYQQMSGTSMATPGAAGIGCLVLQQWHSQFPGAPDPLPETMKAILINSTTDINPVGVDYQTGYGLINALKAVDNLIAGGVLESALEQGEAFTRNIAVANGQAALDVSIAWSDVPAAGNVIPTLVNDLDLYLEAPGGTLYRPWILNPASPGSAATTGIDTINVCERVHVANPASGTWIVHVTGQINSGSSQTFGLAANVALVTGWATISGQVHDNGNQPILGRVSVVGGSQADLTDASGNYLISVPGNANYTLRAISYGFVAGEVTVNVSTGNVTQNFTLNPAQNGTLHGTIHNQFGSPLSGVVVSFVFPNATIPSVTTDANGVYTVQLSGGNEYEVIADYNGITQSATVTVPQSGNVTQDFTFSDPRFSPTGPDNYGYYAYEVSDTGLSAQYSWMEISPTLGGPGSPVTGAAGNDWVTNVTVPFPVRLYGQQSTTLRIAADGWIGVGGTDNGNAYSNQPIPTAGTPNGIVCLFWDDLYPQNAQGGAGDISYYHDAANGKFIIEYHNVAHFSPQSHRVTAQAIFYDLNTRPTQTNDNEIVLQWQSLDYFDSSATDADATVGIENDAGDDGIQIVYNGATANTCYDIAPQSAIRFTTGAVSGFGSVQGNVVLLPPPADITQVSISFGPYLVHPNTEGHFSVANVIANTYDLTVSLPTYELGQTNFTVIPDSSYSFNYLLYRLDPATNLTGTVNTQIPEIRLNWNRPISSTLNPPHVSQTFHVTVSSNQFSPSSITVAQGDSVIWTNTQGFHNVHNTSTPSRFGNTPGSAPWVYRWSVPTDLPPGTYHYMCEIHGAGMAGDVIVVPAGNQMHDDHGALDALTGYEVWLGGTGRLTTITDTFYVYTNVSSRAYNFWIKAIYDGGVADTSNHYRVTVNLAADDQHSLIPSEFYLNQNYPNPFNPETNIEYGLPKASEVKLEIFNLLGQKVATLFEGRQDAGRYHVNFKASEMASGLYYYKLEAGDFRSLQKMLLLK